MLSAKFAVLRQIETIFYDHNRKKAAFKVIWGLIWANVLIYTATTFVFAFACTPPKKLWKPEIEGRCIDLQYPFVVTSVLNLVSDLPILVVPLIAVAKLQAPLKNKVIAYFTFSVGIL